MVCNTCSLDTGEQSRISAVLPQMFHPFQLHQACRWLVFVPECQSASGMQDKEGHLKPIEAENDDLKATQTSRPALIAPLNDDLTLAISLQEDELEQYSARSAPPQQILPCRGRYFLLSLMLPLAH